MKFDIITLFPEMFDGVFGKSIVKRAIDKKIFELKSHQLRNWSKDKYGTVDDKVFGGGVGMLLKCDIVFDAIQSIRLPNKSRVVALTARGKRFTQKDAERLSGYDQIILVCGHYEGFDARIEQHMVDECISIGDYVLTGGEIPAMVIVDTVSRLLKNVLGKDESSKVESFSKISGKRKIEYPQYTRPREFMGLTVPEELVSGDPKKIERWQKQEQLKSQKKDTLK